MRILTICGCLKACFFRISPPRWDQDSAAVTVILCNGIGSALICHQVLGKHKRMHQMYRV